jgi:hypothetical protein
MRTYVDSGKYRGLVRLCGVMGWAGGLEYAARGHEQPAGAPRERHIGRRILLRRIGRLLDDGLRDLGVRVTALVQRGACACSDACRCCQLPASALALPLDSLVVHLRQNIHALRSSLCILYSCTASTTACTKLFTSFTSIYTYTHFFFFSLSLSLSVYTYVYIYIVYIYIHIHIQ